MRTVIVAMMRSVNDRAGVDRHTVDRVDQGAEPAPAVPATVSAMANLGTGTLTSRSLLVLAAWTVLPLSLLASVAGGADPYGPPSDRPLGDCAWKKSVECWAASGGPADRQATGFVAVVLDAALITLLLLTVWRPWPH